MWFDQHFVMFDGLDFDAPKLVRLEDHLDGELTRGFAGSPRYQHPPGEAWRCIATSRSQNDDLGVDSRGSPRIDVGDVFADTVNEPPELIQVISLQGY